MWRCISVPSIWTYTYDGWKATGRCFPNYTACCNFLAYRVCAECSTDYLTKYVTTHHLPSFYQAFGGDVLKPPPIGTYSKLCSPLILLNFSTSVTASQPRLIKRTRIRFQLHRWWDPLELRIPWRDQGAAFGGKMPHTGFAIITWNNPKKLEKPWITKGF